MLFACSTHSCTWPAPYHSDRYRDVCAQQHRKRFLILMVSAIKKEFLNIKLFPHFVIWLLQAGNW